MVSVVWEDGSSYDFEPGLQAAVVENVLAWHLCDLLALLVLDHAYGARRFVLHLLFAHVHLWEALHGVLGRGGRPIANTRVSKNSGLLEIPEVRYF